MEHDIMGYEDRDHPKYSTLANLGWSSSKWVLVRLSVQYEFRIFILQSCIHFMQWIHMHSQNQHAISTPLNRIGLWSCGWNHQCQRLTCV